MLRILIGVISTHPESGMATVLQLNLFCAVNPINAAVLPSEDCEEHKFNFHSPNDGGGANGGQAAKASAPH